MSAHHWQNPAFDHCDASYFLAYRDGNCRPYRRHHLKPTNLESKHARFGFVDFIDDEDVVDALRAAESWARSRGWIRSGPLGFTDMDHEECSSSFDHGTMATIYNPYYPVHMERMGYIKEQDCGVSHTDSARGAGAFRRMSEIVKRRFGLVMKRLIERATCIPREEIFQLIKAYKELFGYGAHRQADRLLRGYVYPHAASRVPVRHPAPARQQMVGVAIGLPAATALRKVKGSPHCGSTLPGAQRDRWQLKGARSDAGTTRVPRERTQRTYV